MQEINGWLDNSGDFESGVALYIKYGNNSFFKKTLEKFGPTPFNITKLSAELNALAPATPANIDNLPQEATIEIQRHPNPDDALHADPPHSPPDPKETERYLSLKVLKQTKYRQLDHNMAALAISAEKHYRHLTAKQILKLFNEIHEIYKLLDFYDEHNRFPVLQVKDDVIRTAADQIQLLRQSTSKARKRLNDGNCRNVHQTELLILENDKKIAELLRKEDAC